MGNLFSEHSLGKYLGTPDQFDYILHGLAFVGVRAVLGIESKTGSPFNVQRSLHISNLSFDEVKDMFDQYQEESKTLKWLNCYKVIIT